MLERVRRSLLSGQRPTFGRLALACLLVGVLGTVGISPIRQAQASVTADVSVQAPVAAGVVVKVINGYNNPPPGVRCDIGTGPDHCDNQKYALDLEPLNTSDLRILAPVSGTVAWIDEGPACIGIRTPESYSLSLCHFGSYSVGFNQSVQRGQVLGNRSTPWIHVSMDDRFRNSAKPPVPFDGPRAFEGAVLRPGLDSEVSKYRDMTFASTNDRTVSLSFSASVCDVMAGCHGPDPSINRGKLDRNSFPSDISVILYNSSNQVMVDTRVPIIYGGFLTRFEGYITLSRAIPSGYYYLKLKLDNTLRKATGPFEVYNDGTRINSAPNLKLVPGDADNSNALNILDWNIISRDCYSDLVPAKDCGDIGKRRRADIDFDGKVNLSDANLYLVMIKNQTGD